VNSIHYRAQRKVSSAHVINIPLCEWEERRNAKRAMLCYFQRRLPPTILLDEAPEIPIRGWKKNIISTGAAGDTTSRNVNVVVSGINSARCDESKFTVTKDATIAGKFECRCLMYVAMLLLSVGDFLRLRIDNRKRYRIPIEQRIA